MSRLDDLLQEWLFVRRARRASTDDPETSMLFYREVRLLEEIDALPAVPKPTPTRPTSNVITFPKRNPQ